MSPARPLSVAVLIELERGPLSGGHVKCWERFAAAAAHRDDLDLTLYVLGSRPGVDKVAGNVRFVALRPALSSRRVCSLVGGVDSADLAPHHPGLARLLGRHEVWHLTHTLAFGATAARLARRRNHPMVGSVHTDVPALTRHYVAQVIDGLPNALARNALRVLRPEERGAAVARRLRNRIFRACDRVLVSTAEDRLDLTSAVPPERIALLRRGVDTALFSPERADRRGLTERYGVPADGKLVVFAGRIDASKGVMLVAAAVRRLVDAGPGAHLVLAGSGAAADRVKTLLGAHVSLLGTVPQTQLAHVFASCDVLAFPSRSETAGNVVAEAMACGLPVVLPRGARTTPWVRSPGQDGLLVDGDEPGQWAGAIGGLLADDDRRTAMGQRARLTAAVYHPSWAQVLDEDLLPVWREQAARRAPDLPRVLTHSA